MVWRDAMPRVFKTLKLICAFTVSASYVFAATTSPPKPLGRLVDLGGHRLHVHCTGQGSPTVVVENGLGDFSFDWTLVQARVSGFTRICTYDRAGYAWSDHGPKPRTFSQLNLELRDALSKLGERGPFVLVGHSYGGPVMRNFAATYPHEVAGMVLVDAAHEGLRVGIGRKKTIRLGDGAKGISIPAPREQLGESDKPTVRAEDLPEELKILDPLYKILPPDRQKMHLWAQSLPADYDADSDIPAAQMEKERIAGQAKLVLLSSNSRQVIIDSGHNMNLEAPEDVTKAIHEVVEAVRRNGKV